MSDPHDYTIGWVTATRLEWVAAQQFLRSRHEPNRDARIDYNIYSLGEIGPHKIVIATAPGYENQASSMASVADSMLRSFPNIRLGLRLGISKSPPIAQDHTPLRDIVVSRWHEHYGEVSGVDLRRTSQGPAFRNSQSLDRSLNLLRASVDRLNTRYKEDGHQLQAHVAAILKSKPHLHALYGLPPTRGDGPSRSDADHQHPDRSYKDRCGHGSDHLVARAGRGEQKNNLFIRFESIASANTVLGDAQIQETLAAEKPVFCFKMKVVGLTNHLPCLKISGFCDYADSHMTRDWRGYAAMVAAAYAKKLLLQIPPSIVKLELPVAEALVHWWLFHWDPLANPERRADPFEGTGAWFLESTAFEEWHSGSRRHLWLYGRPGCGKTFLSTTILEYLETKGHLVLSFFFALSLPMEETVDDMLRSLASQLCRHSDQSWEQLHSLYKSCQDGQKQPTTGELLSVVRKMLRNHEKICILLDALDESTTRAELLSWLREIISTPELSHVRFLFTGRRGFGFDQEVPALIGEDNCIQLDGKMTSGIELVLGDRRAWYGRKGHTKRSSNNGDSDVSQYEPDSASEVESILSLPSDNSSATSFSDNLNVPLSGLVDFLCNDTDLQLSTLLQNDRVDIDIERFSRNFGRLLRAYGRGLLDEASNPLQVEVAKFIRKSASRAAKRIGADLMPQPPDQAVIQGREPLQCDEELLNKWIESQSKVFHSHERLDTDIANQEVPSPAASESDDSEIHESPMANSLEAAKVFLRSSKAHVKLRKDLRRWLKMDDDELSDPEEQSVPETWTPADIYSPYSMITLPMFVNSLLDIWGLSLQLPAPARTTRVTWRCECGTWLSDGVVEMRPQAAEALQLALTGSSQLSNQTSSKMQNIMHSLSNTVKLTTQLLWNLVPGKAQPSGHQASQLPMCTTTAASATGKQNNKDSIRLLLCIDKGLRTTLLYQEPLLNITTDCQVFDFLRLKYYEHRGLTSWFTLRGVKSVALTKFNIDASCFAAVSRHNLNCVQQTCECIPPLTRVVDSKEYSCSPSPEHPPSTIPAFTPCRLTHYFLKPHAAFCDRQSAILRQLPKRVGGGELQALPEGFEDGWGLHFQEDWHWPSVLFVCAVFIVASLVFGVTWAAVTKDLQSGFAVSAVILAIPPVPLALMIVQDSV